VTNGADAVALALREAGVDVAFGLPGVHNLALWPAFERAGIRIVGSRHEQGCAYAADGYARATGKVGVALVTTGPGAANTLGAVGEAWASHSPVVVIATDIPATLRRAGAYRGVLHETTDQAALFAPVTKHRCLVDDAHYTGAVVANAVALAGAAPSGPVYVGVPTDVLGAGASAFKAYQRTGGPKPSVRDVVAALADAQRPLLWVGGGARAASEGVAALASTLGAPVVTTYQGRGVLPAGHPMLVPAPPHEPEVTELIASAGTVVVVGSDLDYMSTMAWRLPLPAHRVAINVDAADATKNYDVDVVLEARAEDVLAPIAASLEPREPWAGDLDALGKTVRDRLRADGDTASAIEFLEHTEAALPDDAVVFADMCIPGYWLAGHLRVGSERSLHYPVGWGTLGFAFPAAVGAAVAHDGERAVVAFGGDGGMLFALGELAAVAQERLPLTVVVVDDGGYGMLRFGHEGEANGSDLSPVDFVTIARGFGIEAEAVDGTGAEYRAALERAVAAGAPRLLHVQARLYPPATTSPRWPIKET
jgi:thiamine pyrophosphate-dependent acetolactate synthase large subunit-like protein